MTGQFKPVVLTSATLLIPTEVVEDGLVAVSPQGRIVYAGPAAGAPRLEGKRIDLRGRMLAPGFIDLHHHGGRGILFEDGADAKQMAAHARWVAKSGVTGFLRTISAPTLERLLSLISAHATEMQSARGGARPLGLHLEGPFLNPDRRGAFNPDWLRQPSLAEMQACLNAGKGWVRMVTLAPELPGAAQVASLLRQNGVVAAMGHTAASYETAAQALEGDFSHSTHTFNAQSGFDHRAPGALGAALSSETATAEVIADGLHVHPAAIKVLLRCLGKDRVILVTDAIPAAGLADGEYRLLGHKVIVKEGAARLPDGTLAGSTVTMDRCMRLMHMQVGAPLHHAVQMASFNPAAVLKMETDIGSLRVGKRADLVVLDESLHAVLTMVGGEVVFEA